MKETLAKGNGGTTTDPGFLPTRAWVIGHVPMVEPNLPARRSPLHQGAIWAITGVLALLTLVGSVQIIRAAFWPPTPDTSLTCAEGVLSLSRALDRSLRRLDAQTTTGEQAAIAIFRQGLDPEWRYEQSVAARCQSSGDKTAERAFRSLVLLRYAEERTVRLEAVDLAERRRTISAILPQLQGPATQAPER